MDLRVCKGVYERVWRAKREESNVGIIVSK